MFLAYTALLVVIGTNAWEVEVPGLLLSGGKCGVTSALVSLKPTFPGDSTGQANMSFASPYSNLRLDTDLGMGVSIASGDNATDVEELLYCNASETSDGTVMVQKTFRVRLSQSQEATAIIAVSDTFEASEERSSVRVISTVTTISCSAGVAGASSMFTVPIDVGLSVIPNQKYPRVWAPWDRESNDMKGKKYIDPLRPSDGGDGWWTGSYRLGVEDIQGAPDRIVAPIAVISFPPMNKSHDGPSDAGLGLHLDPSNAPLDDYLLMQGTPKAAGIGRRRAADGYYNKSLSTLAPASLVLRQRTARLQCPASQAVVGAPDFTFAWDVVPHRSDPRDALRWEVREGGPNSVFWRSPGGSTASMAASGLGTYSWWPKIPNATVSSQQGVRVGWDLSGRFFPYMGMFLPPVEGDNDEWLNDPEGTQSRANVSRASIAAYYAGMQHNQQGGDIAQLSYFNVNEFGLNVTGYRPQGSPPAPQPDDWRNASRFIASTLQGGPLWNYATGDGELRLGQVMGTWQNGIVLDSAVRPYEDFLMEQLQRHSCNLTVTAEDGTVTRPFRGVVIDRSDHTNQYNLDADDGISTVQGRPARSLRLSFLHTITRVRDQLNNPGCQSLNSFGEASHQQPLMLLNTNGASRIDLMQPFDGTFSEGHAVNAVGILGAASPAILWVYPGTGSGCCANQTSTLRFFHRHLYMGVFPMAPYPGNDHAIPYSSADQKIFAMWAPGFEALLGREMAVAHEVCFLADHEPLVSTRKGSLSTPTPWVHDGELLANCFVIPGKQLVFTAVAYGQHSMSEARSSRPATARVRGAGRVLESSSGGTGVIVEQWVPGSGSDSQAGNVWQPVPASSIKWLGGGSFEVSLEMGTDATPLGAVVLKASLVG